ncbi:MAG TPA: trypsin-like peptidase domain-containing protein [Planctomycetota bacterium]|nr:trypsin-like peptidase domain-containing protein [Planctomycetota bacterium]
MRFLTAALAALVLSSALACQGIDPVGQVHPAAQPLANVAILAVPAIDRGAISLEDETRRQQGQPARYAMPQPVTVAPTTHGTWETLDATWSLWRLRIQSPGASHINLGFARFHLPRDARLMIYSSDYSDVVRPFTEQDHTPTGDLWTPVVRTEEIVVEVYVPTAARAQVVLSLTQVGSGYRFFGAGGDAFGIDPSGPCQIDVACSQGLFWLEEIPCVAALSSSGSIFCTGFMVNNTAQDGRNYVITAHHCGVTVAVASSLVCYWNYRNPTCGGTGATLTQFNTGATLRASFNVSDFTLVELFSAPNVAWGVTYAGWNRNITPDATSGTGIHHPSGDAKKISFEYQPTITTSYGGLFYPGDGTHIRLVDWDLGTTEPGSSGSPLFDQNHRVVGQLHGGGSACGLNNSDWYGKFAVSWTGGGTSATRLSNWLDPQSLGLSTLDTLVPVLATAVPFGSGCYQTRGCFAQIFAPNTFDLGGTVSSTVGVSFVPIPNGYTVQAGPDAWFTPTSPNLGLADDALATLTLPFSFAFPGGSTTDVRMSSNGFLWLNGTSTDPDLTPSSIELAQQPARFAPFWMNLNPAAGGTCHYDVDPTNTEVYFTWDNVPAYTTGPTGPGNSFQLVLRADQSAEFRYRQMPNQSLLTVVGWSRGAQMIPPLIDLSAALPFQVSVDQNALGFVPINRPILGTSQVINITNIPNPAGSIGLALIGSAAIVPGLNLSVIGAPGCFLNSMADVIQPVFPLVGATTPWGLPIPNTTSLSGTHVYCQGALLVPPGTNAFGVLTANSVNLTIGTQ